MRNIFIKIELIFLKLFGRLFRILNISNRITYLLIYRIIHRIEKKRIYNVSRNFIDSYSEKNISIKTNKNSNYIWIMWWQGIENAPEIVKACVQSVIKNNPQKNIIIITQKNLGQYITLPNYILDKFNNGSIQMPGFSDIVRMTLLSDYGGMWVDATVLCTHEIPEVWFNNSFYSCRSDNVYEFPQFIPLMRWSAFLISSNGDSAVIDFCKEFYYDYWKHENSTIVYHLIDYIIEIGYERFSCIREEIDAINLNNVKLFEMVKLFDGNSVDSSLSDNNNYLFKLSYKLGPKKLNMDNELYRSIVKKYKGEF